MRTWSNAEQVRAPLADAAQGLDTSESAAPDDDQRCTDLGCDLDDAAVGGSAFELDRRLPPAGLDDRGRLVHPGPVSGISRTSSATGSSHRAWPRSTPPAGPPPGVRVGRRRRGGSDAETALPRPRARRGRSTRRDAPWRSRRCRRRFSGAGAAIGADREEIGLQVCRRRQQPGDVGTLISIGFDRRELVLGLLGRRPPPAEDPPQLPARESRRASPASGPGSDRPQSRPSSARSVAWRNAMVLCGGPSSRWMNSPPSSTPPRNRTSSLRRMRRRMRGRPRSWSGPRSSRAQARADRGKARDQEGDRHVSLAKARRRRGAGLRRSAGRLRDPGAKRVRASELCDLRIGQVRLHDPGGARFRIPERRRRPASVRCR